MSILNVVDKAKRRAQGGKLQLKKFRKHWGFSQVEVAELLKVNQTAVSQWERGITYPRPEKCLRLTEIFDCTLDELWNRNQT